MCAGARAAVIGLPGATVTHGLSDKSVLNISISISQGKSPGRSQGRI